MPRLSVYYVRASLLYLLLGSTIGGLMLANKGIMISSSLWTLLPLHIEFALVGWMIQLAMGVAFWILPRYRQGPPRGNELLSWTAFVLVNLGILGCTLDIVVDTNWLFSLGRSLETLALITFAIGNWNRVKPFDD